MAASTTVNFHISTPLIGNQDINVTSTTQKHPLGTLVRAVDVNNGEGEFIYLLGVASTVAGSVVTWNASTFQTALALAGANKPWPVGWAMSANVATQFGWYQVSGLVVAKKTCSVSIPVGAVGILTTGLTAATGTGKELEGVTNTAISSNKAGNVTALLIANRPHLMGRIT